MKILQRTFSMKLLMTGLLITAMLSIPVSAADAEQNAASVLGHAEISVSPQIDSISPDKETAAEFMAAPTYDFVFDCLCSNGDLSKIPSETLSFVLENFEYHTADDEIVVRNITISELLSGMTTPFSGHGWDGSYEYIKCIVNDPVQKSDLQNAYNFIQYIAKQDGFGKTIPLRFKYSTLVINSEAIDLSESIPNDSNQSKNIDLMTKSDKLIPIFHVAHMTHLSYLYYVVILSGILLM